MGCVTNLHTADPMPQGWVAAAHPDSMVNQLTNWWHEWQTVTPMVIGSTLTNVCLSNGEYDACLKYSGCRTYPQWPLHRNHPWFSCIGRSAAHTR